VEHELPAESRQSLETDEDLKSLHGDSRFHSLAAVSRQRAATAQKSN
jgi:hypothetical protein